MEHDAGIVRVGVIGAGGLGCAVLPRLVRMRVEHLAIIDGDRVEATNLPRQPIYEEVDVGHAKASTAAMWLRQLPTAGSIVAHAVFLDAGNAHHLLSDLHLVVEGVDDLHAKTLIDRTCAELGIPLVSGAVHGGQGQVLVLHAPGANNALGRAALYSGRPGPAQDGCDMRNVSLTTLEEVGRMMAQRVHDLLHGKAVINGRIELLDAPRGSWTSIDPPLS